MRKQCLDVHQMQHLQELGLELDYDTLFRYVKFEDSDWLLKPSSDLDIIGISCRYIPAYTLQDVLDALPKVIDNTYKLCIEPTGGGRAFWCVYYYSANTTELNQRSDETLIDAAYELLIWCIEQGYVEINKNE